MNSIFAALLLAAAPAQPTISADEFCATYGSLAETIMKARQNEVPIGEVLKFFNRADLSDEMREALRGVVFLAYDEINMKFTDDPLIDDAVLKQQREFRNLNELMCLKAFEDEEV